MMKTTKNHLTLILGLGLYCASGLPISAQSDCDSLFRLAYKFIEGGQKGLVFLPQDFQRARTILEPCAQANHPASQNALGMLYLHGMGVDQDLIRAAQLFSTCAHMEHPACQYNLGRAYKLGDGVEQDFEQAVLWLKRAAGNGSQKALYTVGYMYYKGLGLPQSYQKAIECFEQSTYPMARHFMAKCYYWGYGVSENEETAIELLKANPIPNSEDLLAYIREEKRKKELEEIADQLAYHPEDTSSVNLKVAQQMEEIRSPLKIKQGSISSDQLSGYWQGKLVALDWSRSRILEIHPLDISFEDQQARWNLTNQWRRVPYTVQGHALFL